ncbi:hypothetical protein LCGC14_1362250 [marine sediment metagenome]|uniref:Uncharacterized protein n=1 Tax=marine sediment metagenome TaxID=412755 RepID=A0A0F9KTT3_9ZZZZ
MFSPIYSFWLIFDSLYKLIILLLLVLFLKINEITKKPLSIQVYSLIFSLSRYRRSHDINLLGIEII